MRIVFHAEQTPQFPCDEGGLAELPPLSAHEQLELRLSMPREFWPKALPDEKAF